MTGTIYLLCFDQPYVPYPGAPAHCCARHYIGWTLNLPERLRQHRQGHGARLIAVITAAGITFQLARTRPGDRATERAIKRCGGATRYCPICTQTPRHGRWGPLPAHDISGVHANGSRPGDCHPLPLAPIPESLPPTITSKESRHVSTRG
jgi:hypothetical protein